MDPMQFLTTRDQFKARVMKAVAREAHRLREIEHENLATAISNAVARSMGGS